MAESHKEIELARKLGAARGKIFRLLEENDQLKQRNIYLKNRWRRRWNAYQELANDLHTIRGYTETAKGILTRPLRSYESGQGFAELSYNTKLALDELWKILGTN